MNNKFQSDIQICLLFTHVYITFHDRTILALPRLLRKTTLDDQLCAGYVLCSYCAKRRVLNFYDAHTKVDIAMSEYRKLSLGDIGSDMLTMLTPCLYDLVLRGVGLFVSPASQQ